MEKQLEQKKDIFTEETISSLQDLGAVLRHIHERLIGDGYTIINGKIRGIECQKIVKKK